MGKKVNRRKEKQSRLLTGIKQGVGAITRSPFPKPGGVRSKPKNSNAVAKMPNLRHALNALHPCHLPLPRAVGSYTVMRTTDVVSANSNLMLFGSMKSYREGFNETAWQNVIGVGGSLSNQPINGTTNTRVYLSDGLASSSLNNSRMVPAAITVQVMNPEALQTSTGIVYIGRSKTVLELNNDSRTWNELASQLVQYSAPRLCSAGKLALRGVQVNAIPNNMSVLSDFCPRSVEPGPTGKTVTWNQTAEGTYSGDFEGFAPIFIYNPNSVGLQYLVTIEWRMRFDPLNPAYAGHVFHPPASESTWQSVVRTAESVGHGVEDIADVVANVGGIVAGVARAGATVAALL